MNLINELSSIIDELAEAAEKLVQIVERERIIYSEMATFPGDSSPPDISVIRDLNEMAAAVARGRAAIEHAKAA